MTTSTIVDARLPVTPYGLLRGPSKVVYGAGQRGGLTAAVAELGSSALLCTDLRMASTPEFAQLTDALRAAGVTVHVFEDVEAELPAPTIGACVEEYAGRGIDVVVGVGGGSCIDHAKVVALLLSHGGALADYYGEFRVPGPTLPVVAVPTTAGTGSEVTPVAVIADPERDMKVGISSPHLIPHTAVVDPELTYGCPPALTAHAAADALTHCIEAFTAIRREPTAALADERVFVGKSLLTDQYALAGIELIGAGLPRVHRDGGDEEARGQLLLGALFGGFALGTAGTAAAHALQYPVGALTHTPHGAGVSSLMPYVMEFNLPACVPEYARVARALGVEGGSEEELARAAVDAVAELVAEVGIPTDLEALGVPEDRLDWVAEQGITAARLVQNNPRELDVPALRRIAGAAFDGDRAALRDAEH